MRTLYNDVGSYARWDSWGLQEHLGQPPESSPKLQGVLDFARRYPRGALVPN